MGTERKIQQRTVENRKKLLCAAYSLFVNKGYYNTNTKKLLALQEYRLATFIIIIRIRGKFIVPYWRSIPLILAKPCRI